MKEKRTLITGGAGFAGTHLANALDGEVVLIDTETPARVELAPNMKYLWKAIQDLTPDDVCDFDYIVHLAAQADVPMGFKSPRWTLEQNVTSTLHLLETIVASGSYPEKLIIAGSGSEYGRALYLPIDENHPLTPCNPYGFSKAAQEMLGWTYYRCYGLPVTVLGTGVVLGPGMRRDVFVFKWLWALLHDQPVTLEGGKQTRDLTYITDVVDAITLTLQADPIITTGKKFLVSYGQELTVEAILDLCIQVTHSGSPKIHRVGYRSGEEGMREKFDISRARERLGYNPKVSPLQAVQMTNDWLLYG